MDAKVFNRKTRETAAQIRALITDLTRNRLAEIANGTAPNDLATKIMTTKDPVTGDLFSEDEMVDQVAIFFLAGHETSAAALSWALYLLGTHPEWQDKVAKEARDLQNNFGALSKMPVTRDVFRETLRLYPPVPMMVREASKKEVFRKRSVKRGAQVVLSPWHLHRHSRLWDRPDAFDPARWQTVEGKASARDAFLPFSSGPRVCSGAGFAMMEGVLLIAHIIASYKISADPSFVPIPEAQLTVRSRNGIYLRFEKR